MNDISQEYLLLFNAITEAEEKIELLKDYLLTVQQQAEELYISKTEGFRNSVINLSDRSNAMTEDHDAS